MSHVYLGGFRRLACIGSGSFGLVFRGFDPRTGTDVALKCEPRSSRHRLLRHEASVYECLAGGVGIPRMHWVGRAGSQTVMAVDLLGPSLQTLLNAAGHRFSLKTVLLLADQMLLRIEFLHSRGILHRDIKPDNFLLGRKDSPHRNTLFIIDFGLSRQSRHHWRPWRRRPRRGPRMGLSLTGTPRYASLSNHAGMQQSWKDDLESLGYVLVYFLRGELPWQGLAANNRRDKTRRIGHVKSTTPLKLMCAGLPPQFRTLIQYARSLPFGGVPDYQALKDMFRQLARAQRIDYDGQFDWVPAACSDPDCASCSRSASGNSSRRHPSSSSHPRSAASADAPAEPDGHSSVAPHAFAAPVAPVPLAEPARAAPVAPVALAPSPIFQHAAQAVVDGATTVAPPAAAP